ncbi:MAG: GFA family protein [Geminicoccaceae bacterium]
MAREGTGGCACGTIRYEFKGDPREIIACHCMYCQTRSGSAFGMSMFLGKDALRITKGKLKIFRNTRDSGRAVLVAICPECGTQIYGEPEWRPDTIVVKPGTLDDTSWLVPDTHIWTSRKQPWIVIPEGVSVHEGQPS